VVSFSDLHKKSRQKEVLTAFENLNCPYYLCYFNTNKNPATANITAQKTTKTYVVIPEMLLTSIFPPVLFM
jgi:hypothetical protein